MTRRRHEALRRPVWAAAASCAAQYGSGNLFDVAHAKVQILRIGVPLFADFARDSDGVLRRDVKLTEHVRRNVYGHGAALVLEGVSVFLQMFDDVAFENAGGHVAGLDGSLHGVDDLLAVAGAPESGIRRGRHQQSYGQGCGQNGNFHAILRYERRI